MSSKNDRGATARSELFAYPFSYAAGTDIGVKRASNQDEVICCPEHGFFAVSDGMGGLIGGGETSRMIAETIPGLIAGAVKEFMGKASPEYAAELLSKKLRLISDSLYEKLNKEIGRTAYGATLCGVWLAGEHAVFINLGDSRGYLLESCKKHIRQVTSDHNVAQILVEMGELTREEARRHSSSSTLTRFVGMESPALPETYIIKIKRGDTILLCSDGLCGMVQDERLGALLRSSDNTESAVKNLIGEANLAGGRDNISVVVIKLPEQAGGDRPIGHMAVWPVGHMVVWPVGHMVVWPVGRIGALR